MWDSSLRAALGAGFQSNVLTARLQEDSTELRCIDIKLRKEKAVGVAVRRSSRQNSQIATRSRDVEAGTQTTKHTLPTDCEGVILDSLW